jgi:hypothetical protein
MRADRGGLGRSGLGVEQFQPTFDEPAHPEYLTNQISEGSDHEERDTERQAGGVERVSYQTLASGGATRRLEWSEVSQRQITSAPSRICNSPRSVAMSSRPS